MTDEVRKRKIGKMMKKKSEIEKKEERNEKKRNLMKRKMGILKGNLIRREIRRGKFNVEI